MPSQQTEKPIEEAFPTTDFREFINSIQGANAVGKRFLDSMALRRSNDVLSPTIELETAERGLLIAEALIEKRRDLNSHYGWILTSDATLVYRSMGGKSEHGTEWARQWVKGIYMEYECVGSHLQDLKLELEVFVRHAKSEGRS